MPLMDENHALVHDREVAKDGVHTGADVPLVLSLLDDNYLEEVDVDDAIPHVDVYSRDIRGRAGCARISLTETLAASFDIERHGEIVELFLGDECDALDLCSLLGVSAARACLNRAKEIEVPRILPRDGSLAANVAVLDRVMAIPMRSDVKRNLASKVICYGKELAKAGFDVAELLRHHLVRLPQMFRPGNLEATRWAHEDQRMAMAIRAGVEYLSPFDDEWQWFMTIVDDLPDERLKLVENLIEPPPTRYQPLAGVLEDRGSRHVYDPSREREIWDRAKRQRAMLEGEASDILYHSWQSEEKYAMRGASRHTGPDWPNEEWLVRRYPLYWCLLDEDVCPPEAGFDDAVRLSRDDYRSRVATIRVQSPSGDERGRDLHGRVTTNGTVMNVATLSPDEHGWSGRIVLPTDFDPTEHEIEVTSSPSYGVIVDHKNEERIQWALLARALEWAELDSRAARSKVEQLTSS